MSKKILLNAEGKVLTSNDKVLKAPESALKKLLDATKSCSYLFSSYTGTSVDDLISYNDTENVTDMSYMFNYCKSLQTIPNLNFSNAKNGYNLFGGCHSITTIPNLDYSNFTNAGRMFYECKALTGKIELELLNATGIVGIFQSCSGITEIYLSAPLAKNFNTIVSYCSKLTKLVVTSEQLVDISTPFGLNTALKEITFNIKGMSTSATSVINSNLSSLQNLVITNITHSLKVGSGTSYGHKLTLESLIGLVKELWNYSDGSSSPTLTIGSANLEKIANTYVLVTDQTTDKMTAEVCDSTTTGAITLQAFAELKGWALA